MRHTLAAIGAVAFMVLDGVWLGLVMKNFYRDQLAPIVRLADGGIAPSWPAAFTNDATLRQWPFALTLVDVAWGALASAAAAMVVWTVAR